jgi:hypothetical protein
MATVVSRCYLATRSIVATSVVGRHGGHVVPNRGAQRSIGVVSRRHEPLGTF